MIPPPPFVGNGKISRMVSHLDETKMAALLMHRHPGGLMIMMNETSYTGWFNQILKSPNPSVPFFFCTENPYRAGL